jgi:glutaredoxin
MAVPYTTRDVTTDEGALRDLEELGYMTTPVIVIDGQIVVGFDRKKLDALLAE